MLLNANKGVVKAIRNNRIVVELPRGGTFTFKESKGRSFKVGESVCILINTVLQKVTDIIPEKEANEIVQIARDEAWGTNLEGLDLEDEDIRYEFDNEEEPYDEFDSERQETESNPDHGSGDDYGDAGCRDGDLAEPDTFDEPSGTTG